MSALALRSALWAIRAQPLRSFALGLSLATAVGCVVFSASILGGFSERLRRLAFGEYANTIVVRANGVVPSRRGGPSLDDRTRLNGLIPNAEGSAAWVEVSAPLRGAGETRIVRVYGALGDYRRELDAVLAEGRWLTETELGGLTRHCLVGATLAADLQRMGRPALDSELSLGGPRCRVVGVLDYADSRPAGRFNDAVIAPFFAARRYFDARGPGEDGAGPREATWLSFFLRKGSDMAEARYLIDRDLRRVAGVPMSRESPYSYDDPGAELVDQARQRDALSRLLWTITGAALVASLTGYGGIALAATAARRREIALRMSMGATARDILTQVATEHAVIASGASVAGFVVGALGAAVAARLWEWPVRLGWPIGLAAVLAGCLAGLAIGLAVAARSAAVPPSLAAKA
ncbi:MAG: ABC transporter permease [Brevundimonas sp.]|uniref:ABC transporter permease n=1 Tax=Brevundimonas sp. TaxID=1871086 RepID=UPI00248A06A2|nr:ABC transporter permease [Brevundimonas sp.]MDI1326163.1 ABC transporter permease [Brevundimonas sp.]